MEAAIAIRHPGGSTARSAAISYAYLPAGLLAVSVIDGLADPDACGDSAFEVATTVADFAARAAASARTPDEGRDNAAPPILNGAVWRCAVALVNGDVHVLGTGCRAYGWTPAEGLRPLTTDHGACCDDLVILSAGRHPGPTLRAEQVRDLADDPCTLAATLATTPGRARSCIVVLRRLPTAWGSTSTPTDPDDGPGAMPLVFTQQVDYRQAPEQHLADLEHC
ncbi:hypothetical protein ACIRBX_25210 [Kitasatospora sp. NPDC096147]|uniref:hypothetical protein n=1 Tax=Kitasatospora sp. NPDC096147 TaxID=3364093 RepID=UPI003819EB79